MKRLCLILICLAMLLSGCSGIEKIATDLELEPMLESMTLEEKVAQMFLVGYSEEVEQSEYTFGGYIFFGKDFKNSDPETFRTKIEGYQSEAKIPLFIAVDEEGGTVNRVSRYRAFREEPFLSPQEVYENGGMEGVAADATEKSAFLLDLGINLNFAPVCDISLSADDYMYARSFGQGAVETSRYVETVVDAMSEAKMGSVLKHFPGYGNNVDTHTGIARDRRSYDTFLNNDYFPFLAGIESGAGMVLVSHNIVECMDGAMPASLSYRVHEELRKKLGFDGVIITDDLAMDAIELYAGEDRAAFLAIQAGNDMICCTNFKTQMAAVLRAVEEGLLSEERIDESVMRILRYKKELGLLN